MRQFGLIMILCVCAPSSVAGVLSVHPDNPLWFANGSDRAVYLGGHQSFVDLQDNSFNKAFILMSAGGRTRTGAWKQMDRDSVVDSRVLARACTRTTSESQEGPQNGVIIISFKLQLDYSQKAHYLPIRKNGHSASAAITEP